MSYGFRAVRTRPDKSHRYKRRTSRKDFFPEKNNAKLPCRLAWKGNHIKMIGEVSILVDTSHLSDCFYFRNLLLERTKEGVYVPIPWVFPIEKTNDKWNLHGAYVLAEIEDQKKQKKTNLNKEDAADLGRIINSIHAKLPELTENRPEFRSRSKRRKTSSNTYLTLFDYFSQNFIDQIDKIYYFTSKRELTVPYKEKHQNA
jgi:hypothetical protein